MVIYMILSLLGFFQKAKDQIFKMFDQIICNIVIGSKQTVTIDEFSD
jgi:hypothetical protein